MTAPDAAGTPDSRSTPGPGQAATPEYAAFEAFYAAFGTSLPDWPPIIDGALEAWKAAAQAGHRAIAAAAPAGTGAPGVVHLSPPDGEQRTPCCDETPFDLPRTDRITNDPALVTCDGPQPQPAPELAAAMAKLDIATAALKRLADCDYNPDSPGEQTFEIAEDALHAIGKLP